MKLNITTRSKIYVQVGANVATGGPELLHQLVYHLRELGFNAFMYYTPNNHKQPIHSAYKFYNNPFVREIEDVSENVIIVPEIYSSMYIFDELKLIQKVIWWLSVDNFFVSRSLSFFPYNLLINFIKVINKLAKTTVVDIPQFILKLNRNFYKKSDKYLSTTNIHFVQSQYAFETLIRIGFNKNQINFLSDYLNKDFLEISFKINEKEDIILYNPTKGYKFTKKIIKQATNLNFVPIVNLNREEVVELFKKAKVYIDFGNHPGKDRMPREAVLAGCCIITGKRGSANNLTDVEIDDNYKFHDEIININSIINRLNDCINNYPSNVIYFNNYRKKILEEKEVFIDSIKKIFYEK